LPTIPIASGFLEAKLFYQKMLLLKQLTFLARIGTYLFDLAGLVVMVQFLNLEPFFSKVFLNVLIIGLNYLLSRIAVFKDMGYP